MTHALRAAAILTLLGASTASAATYQVTGSFGPNELVTFEFSVTGPGTFLDFNTNASSGDTELGLYAGQSPTATLVANDDDGGFNTRSTLSFGTGSGLVLDETGATFGEDGVMLGLGDYTLVLGQFSVGFGSTLADAQSLGSTGLDYVLDVYTDASVSGFAPVPLPAGAVLLLCGLGALAATRRRKA